jgi:hypothetical protein
MHVGSKMLTFIRIICKIILYYENGVFWYSNALHTHVFNSLYTSILRTKTNDEKNQPDATTVIYYHKLTLHASGIYMPIFRSTGCNLLHVVFGIVRENKVFVVSYNLYSWRWAYKCPKYVELVYDNKLHLLHQVGSSRHCYIRCTVTHTSNTYKNHFEIPKHPILIIENDFTYNFNKCKHLGSHVHFKHC